MMLLLATEIWRTHGGVQRYMQLLARILGSTDDRLTAVTFLDEDSDRENAHESFHAICCAGGKMRFCLAAILWACRRRTRVVFSGHTSLLPVAWVLKITRIAKYHVLVLHGTEAWRRLSWFGRWTLTSVDVIVATTNYTVQEFSHKNKPVNIPFVVIPLACELQPSGADRTPPTTEVKLLTVSRLSSADRYKGIDTALRAVSAAREYGLRLSLDVIGSGNDELRLREVAHSLNLVGAVRFHGSISDRQLQSLLEQSDVFVLPSKKEGFGIVYVEAMAAGLPCIGANHGGVPEVIEHGESGFLIEYGDVRQLVFYLRALSESPALYRMMSRAARARACGPFSLDHMTRMWQHLIDSLVGPVSWKASDEPRVPAILPVDRS